VKLSFLCALLFSCVSLLACHLLFGGKLIDLIQVPGLILVCFGTFFSLLMSYSYQDIEKLILSFFAESKDQSLVNDVFMKEMLLVSQTIRKEGLLALDQKKADLKHFFLKKYTNYLAQGMEKETLRDLLDSDLASLEKESDKNADIFESAGLFSPTFGMMGAVFGLLPIFNDLSNTQVLGTAMVSAFITLVYGLALAYMFFLPLSIHFRKSTVEFKRKSDFFKMCILSLQEGMSPIILEEKLKGFYGQSK